LNASIPILADPLCGSASSAGTATAREHRQVYDMTARGGSGVLQSSSSTIATVEIAPFLLETAAGISSVSSPYVDYRGIVVDQDLATGFGTEITTSASQSYAYATFVAGWAGVTRPNGPLKITFVLGAGTGAGTIKATGTLKAEKADTSKFTRYRVKFAAPVSAGGFTQYSLRFESPATSGKGWRILRLDTGSNTLTTTTAANVEGQGWGGQTDAYFAALTRDTRYDLAANIVSTSNPPGSFTATATAAT
jgi:hypothetical protein